MLKLKNYFLFCIKGILSKRIRETAISILKNDTCRIEPVKFGEKNKGKKIYIIDCCQMDFGFFATYRYMLMALIFADRCGFLPVVDYTKNFPYSEKKPVNGKSNPFEYYFKQPCGIELEDAYKSAYIVKYQRLHCDMIELLLTGKYGSYETNDLWINEAAYVQKKYIRLNEKLETEIRWDISNLIGSKSVLGIHIRGTDFKKNYNGHPVSVPIEEYIENTKSILFNNNLHYIFLATDDINALELFKENFGEKLLFYEDEERSKEDISVMRSKPNRENHYYKLGKEVLRDAFTLSYSTSLLAGVSQVSIMARVLKKSRDEKFESLTILNKGVNQNNNNFI